MDIHKPKPWHGLREFLKEYSIIVLGVLTALALEQSVEWLHWRHEVEAERTSLLSDANDMSSVIRERQKEQSCIDTRLQEVHALIQRNARREPLGLIGPMGQHVRSVASIKTWDIAVSGQALSHMSHHEKLAFSDAFGSYANWNDSTAKEADAWSRLAPLNEANLLNEMDWSNVRSAYWQALQINDRLKILAPLFLRRGRSDLSLPDAGASALTGGFIGAEAAMCRPFVTL